MAERSPQDQDKYIVRFPDGMRDRLKAEAAKNNRSLNAEIIARLQESLSNEAQSGVVEALAGTFKRDKQQAGLGPILDAMAREEYRALADRMAAIESLLKDIGRSKK